MKNLLERILAGVLLILSLPFLILASLIIMIESRGNPLFKQIRIGKRGENFWMYKLRTMKCGSEAMHILIPNELDIYERHRITKFGQILRKLHLDETPQLWNIVLGKMAFVGPRPIPLRFTLGNYYAPKDENVLPGLTGLHQINKIDHSEWNRKRLDRFYCQKKSISFDLFIIFLTAKFILKKVKIIPM